MPANTCATCEYFAAAQYPNTPADGLCRRYPPAGGIMLAGLTPSLDGKSMNALQNGYAVSPAVNSTVDWCGEHRARREAGSVVGGEQ